MAEKKTKRNSEVPKESVKERLASHIGIDRDIILNLSHIELIGNREIFIENYKGIIEYTDTLIRVNTNPGPLKIEGKMLEIKNVSQEMLHIAGYLKFVGVVNN